MPQLYKFLSEYTPRYYPGSHYEYANLGFGLLGHVLSLRAGRGYEELVVSRICEPLGLNDTRITLTTAMDERLAQGHDASLHAIPGWDQPPLAGAGALRHHEPAGCTPPNRQKRGLRGGRLVRRNRAQRRAGEEVRFAGDLYGAFSVKRLFWVCCQFFVRRCVQVRLACSAGDSPAGVKVRAP